MGKQMRASAQSGAEQGCTSKMGKQMRASAQRGAEQRCTSKMAKHMRVGIPVSRPLPSCSWAAPGD
eukprot:4010570-Alexandrium_andersonii.AAC.1